MDKKYLQSYKYIGLGFQLVAVVGIFVLLGLELDKMLLNQTPFLTIIMSIIGVAASLYYVIKDVSKKKIKKILFVYSNYLFLNNFKLDV